jgi:type IV pilus assembly protein PilA
VRARLSSQDAFSLIELLVVLLILGVLAAIALPVFLGQQNKSEDASAKSNARNLVSLIDSCYAPQEDYTQCASEADLGTNIGIPYGTNPGEASITDTSKSTFTIVAVSKAQTNGSNNTFTIERLASGPLQRTCSGGAGCRNGTW